MKFNRDPLFDVTRNGRLVNRQIGVGKLTYSAHVDTCPVLAWLVWAILYGAFGFAPYERVAGGGVMGHNALLQGPADWSCEDVDRLVGSVFAIKPWFVPAEMRDAPMMTGQMLHGSPFSVFTVLMSRVVTNVGIALGLNPRKCSAISGRKTAGTAVTNHAEATDLDATAALGHANPNLTSKAIYTDATRLNGDTTALMRGEPVRAMPGSVELAHSRNLAPDMAAGIKVGQAARRAQPCSVSYWELFAGRRRRVGAAKARLYAWNAYNKAFRAEMQRQFDAQAEVSKCGDTEEVLNTWFFTPLECGSLSQAQFVSWQIKKALKLL